jgi:hypothetical protein
MINPKLTREYFYQWTDCNGNAIIIARVSKSKSYFELTRQIFKITFLRPEPRWENNRKWLKDCRTGERSKSYIKRIGCKACFLHPNQVLTFGQDLLNYCHHKGGRFLTWDSLLCSHSLIIKSYVLIPVKLYFRQFLP